MARVAHVLKVGKNNFKPPPKVRVMKLLLNYFDMLLLGAIHKGRPHPRGEGGLVKSGHMRTQGGRGGSVAKCGRPQNSNFYLNFRSLFIVL